MLWYVHTGGREGSGGGGRRGGEWRAGLLCPAVSLDIHSSSSLLHCRLFTLHAYPHTYASYCIWVHSNLLHDTLLFPPSSSPLPPLPPPPSPPLLPPPPPSSSSSSFSSSGGRKRGGSDESGSVSSRQQLHGRVHSGPANDQSFQQTLLAGVIQGENNV